MSWITTEYNENAFWIENYDFFFSKCGFIVVDWCGEILLYIFRVIIIILQHFSAFLSCNWKIKLRRVSLLFKIILEQTSLKDTWDSQRKIYLVSLSVFCYFNLFFYIRLSFYCSQRYAIGYLVHMYDIIFATRIRSLNCVYCTQTNKQGNLTKVVFTFIYHRKKLFFFYNFDKFQNYVSNLVFTWNYA